MYRLFNLSTPVLALVLSVAGEIVFMVLGAIAGRQGRPGEVTEFSRLFMLFHDPPSALSHACMNWLRLPSAEPAGSILFILLALLQWYIILFLAIFLYRRFRKKTA